MLHLSWFPSQFLLNRFETLRCKCVLNQFRNWLANWYANHIRGWLQCGLGGFCACAIDNFTVSKRMLMRCNCYVMSHPEYTPCLIWSMFPLKTILNIGEFEICTLASCTAFSNKTITNQSHVSARVSNPSL